MLAFNSQGKMMFSSTKHHLILLVLFIVLLFQCEYVNARPNATASLFGVENNAGGVRIIIELHPF